MTVWTKPQLLPHLLDILKLLTFKRLAIVSLHCTGKAWLVLMNLFRKKSHITLRSCVRALCFDPTTLFEIAVYQAKKLLQNVC